MGMILALAGLLLIICALGIAFMAVIVGCECLGIFVSFTRVFTHPRPELPPTTGPRAVSPRNRKLVRSLAERAERTHTQQVCTDALPRRM